MALWFEDYTPDGKRQVRREQSVGGVVVKGFVLTILVVAIVILVLAGHPFVSLPVSLSGISLKWLGK